MLLVFLEESQISGQRNETAVWIGYSTLQFILMFAPSCPKYVFLFLCVVQVIRPLRLRAAVVVDASAAAHFACSGVVPHIFAVS